MFNLTKFLETIRSLNLSPRQNLVLGVVVIAAVLVQLNFTKK